MDKLDEKEKVVEKSNVYEYSLNKIPLNVIFLLNYQIQKLKNNFSQIIY